MGISVPDGEAREECPLTLDPIATSLPCLPGALFMEEPPLHTKLTLTCDHAFYFYALSLLYSWCKNGMLCPCCRAGVEDRADPDCFQDRAFHIYGGSILYTTLADAGCLPVRLILSLQEV